jgi:long-chain acyl-CoA synthetase
VACQDESWTFREFDRLTDHFASNLLAAGAEPGDRVAVHLLNGLDAALTYIGCLKAGCIVVPVNNRLKGREIDYILRHSGSALYIGRPDLYSEIVASCPVLGALPRYLTGGTGIRDIRSFSELSSTAGRSSLLSPPPPDQPAAILYTSGTTAHPKGAVHSHRTLLETSGTMRQMNLDEDQVVVVITSMAHLIGFGMLFLSALVNGATTVITRPFETENALDSFARWKCTYTLGLPVMFECLLRSQVAAPRNVTSGRFYFCGGDSVTPALQEAFERAFAPICEAYGCTEVTPLFWNRPGEARVGSIGKPAVNSVVQLVDPNGAGVAPGSIGEIRVRAPHLMTGYWQDATAGVRDGWFHTGDLAHVDDDGFYWFAGRKKELIIRGGSNVSPQEVEAVLADHPSVAEAAVVGRPEPFWGEMVVAHVALRPGARLDEEELIAFARERLADYKTPGAVVFHSELPKGPTGKLMRRALREKTDAAAAPTRR